MKVFPKIEKGRKEILINLIALKLIRQVHKNIRKQMVLAEIYMWENVDILNKKRMLVLLEIPIANKHEKS